MTEDRNTPRREFSGSELAVIGAYLPDLRRSLSGDRILRQYLVIGFFLGLAAYVGGYVLRATAPGEPLALLTDLLYAFGGALWTGVVVVLFVQVVPEAKRRRVERAIKEYETTRR